MLRHGYNCPTSGPNALNRAKSEAREYSTETDGPVRVRHDHAGLRANDAPALLGPGRPDGETP